MKKILYFFIVGFLGTTIASCNGNKEAKANFEDSINAHETGKSEILPASTLDNPNFKVVDNVIISENLPVVVDFYADWCGPCKQYAPVFHTVAEKYQGIVCFVSINVDDYPELANAYEVSSIPTTVFITTGGGVIGAQKGVIPEETLVSYVDQLVANTAGNDMGI